MWKVIFCLETKLKADPLLSQCLGESQVTPLNNILSLVKRHRSSSGNYSLVMSYPDYLNIELNSAFYGTLNIFQYFLISRKWCFSQSRISKHICGLIIESNSSFTFWKETSKNEVCYCFKRCKSMFPWLWKIIIKVLENTLSPLWDVQGNALYTQNLRDLRARWGWHEWTELKKEKHGGYRVSHTGPCSWRYVVFNHQVHIRVCWQMNKWVFQGSPSQHF